MGKKFIAAVVVLFAASTIGFAIIGYKAVAVGSAGSKVLAEYDWTMEPTSEYRRIECTGMDGDYFSAMVNTEKSFLIDAEGKKIDQVDSGWIDGEGSSYTYSEKGRIGYKSLDGRILIPARYDYLGPFDGGYADAYIGNRHFAVDEKGREAYRTREDESISFRHIYGKHFGEEYQETYKVIDVETGKTIKEWNPGDCKDICYVMPGLYQAVGDGGCYFLDENFDVTFDESVYEQRVERSFSEGLCYVEKISNASYESIPDNYSTKTGYIDGSGKMAIETKGSLYGGDFSEGKALIYGEKEAWAIDKTGKKLFTIRLKKSLDVTSVDAAGPFRLYVFLLSGSVFQNGMVPVYDGEKMGLADKKGKWILEPVFDEVDFVGDRLVAVDYHGKWGMVRV